MLANLPSCNTELHVACAMRGDSIIDQTIQLYFDMFAFYSLVYLKFALNCANVVFICGCDIKSERNFELSVN
jgi:hypothetical protein